MICESTSDGFVVCKREVNMAAPSTKESTVSVDEKKQERSIIFRQNSDSLFYSQNLAETIVCERMPLNKHGMVKLVCKSSGKRYQCKIITHDPEGRIQVLTMSEAWRSEDKKDANVTALVASITGVCSWSTLHSIPYLRDKPVSSSKIAKFVRRFGRCMTCPKCHNHFTEFAKTRDIDEIKDMTDLHIWLCTLHNEINVQNDKVEWKPSRTHEYYKLVAKNNWKKNLLPFLYFTITVPGRQKDHQSLLRSLSSLSSDNCEFKRPLLEMSRTLPDDRAGSIKMIYDKLESILSPTGWSLEERHAMVDAASLYDHSTCSHSASTN